MKRAIISCLSVALISVCFLISCREDTHGNVYYSFKDSLGNEVVLHEKPERVAVLFSSFVEIWNLAGGDTAITVKESIERDLCGDSVFLVDNGAGKTVNTELLISYEPDFVICSADIVAQVDCADVLRSANIPCALMRVESLDDYLKMLKICTEITECTENYDTYGENVRNNVENILSSVPEAEAPPKILFIRAGSTGKSTKAKTADNNFVCRMLKELGSYNIAENAPILLDGLSLEEILREDPDLIFISTMGDENAAIENMEKILEGDGYKELSAVKNGHCHFLPKEMFQYKPNAKWAEAYQYLAEKLYEKD